MRTIQLKRLGKKKVKLLDFEISENPETLQDLIEQCVKAEVTRYNEKRENAQLIHFLSPADIQEQGEKGKIGFGEINNTTLAMEQDAIETALLGFKDGLFVVFVDDEEIKEMNQPLHLTSKSVIVFMRLTFLTGTYW